MRRLREILRLKHDKRLSNRAIAKAVAVSAGSVSEYVSKARRLGLTWPLPDELDDQGLEELLFPQSESQRERSTPDFNHIHRELRRAGVTLQLLWQEYIADDPAGYGYSHFCDLYRRWEGRLSVTMRQVHRAGEKVFVDFAGKRPSIVDPRTGEETPVELFVGVLGASSYTYAEATESQDLHSWTRVQRHMFEYFGGVPEVLVPDNLKSGVTKPCRYEPIVNATYLEFAEHYGAAVVPARSGKPRDKAKAETGVQVVERWILAVLRNRRFFSLRELNEAIRGLLSDLNAREMKHLGASRRELFESLDAPQLRTLPEQPYEFAEWKRAKVNIDYHIALDWNYYSVPYRLIREHVDVRFTGSTVEIFHKSRRVALHARRQGRGQAATNREHMPSSHRIHAEWTPLRLISWADKVGLETRTVVEAILDDRPHPEQGFRSCLGLLRLSKQHGVERLEAACHRARALNSPSYRTVKNILASGLDQLLICDEQPEQLSLTHHNIRGSDYYLQEETHVEPSDA